MSDKRSRVFLFIFFGFIMTCQAQQPGSLNQHCLPDAAYFKSYLYDTKDIAIAPVYWNGKKWLGFASVTAVSSYVYFNDGRIQKIFQANRSYGGDRFSKYFLEPWGSGLYASALMAALYIEGMLYDNTRSKRMALLGTKTLLITALYSRVPKYAFQRHRPYQDSPSQAKSWEGPLHGISDFTSFTSGHAVSAFAMATVIATEYADKWAVPLIAYSLAGAVSLSRIYDNKHWASDVLVGAAFGYAMGKLIYNRDNWNKQRKRKILNSGI